METQIFHTILTMTFSFSRFYLVAFLNWGIAPPNAKRLHQSHSVLSLATPVFSAWFLKISTQLSIPERVWC